MTRGKKRALIVAAVAVVALVSAIAGYAYWSTTGSGTGTATAGTTVALTLHGTVPAGIYPGGSKTVTLTADNTNPGSVRVGTVTLASVSVDAGHVGCVTADFTMPAVAENVEIANGTGLALPNPGTLSMADTGVSQDLCKGATLTLNLTSN